MPTFLNAISATVSIYLPSWFAGVTAGLFISALAWFAGRQVARAVYLLVAGASFIPVTILMPYFVRNFGLNLFAFPLLALPVSLVMCASFHEAFGHSNKTRSSLMINYRMNRVEFFFRVLLRESLPSVHSSLRFTLSLSFAIFLALDYFVESWGGLGALVRHHYNRLAFDFPTHSAMMGRTVIAAAVLGSMQVLILTLLLRPLTDYRKHY